MSPTVPDSVPETAPEAAPSAASPTVLTRSVRYHADGGALLEQLTRSGLLRTTAGPAAQGGSVRPVDCVLLESADITTKASRTTVAVLEASARLTCWGGTVMAEALDAVDGGAPGADGLAALARLEAGLAEHVTDRRPGRLTLTLPTICDDDPSIEERERLTALSTIEPLRLLARAEVDHPHLPLEAGAFAFDYLSTFESLPEVAQGANTCPDYLFYDARIILVVDHPTQEATLVGASVDAADLERRMEALATAIDRIKDPANSADTAVEAPAPAGGPDSPVLHAVPTVSDADFEAVVEEMRGYIADGDVYQVVPSRGFTIDCPDALAAYHVLRHANPSPYMFYLAAPDFELFGASPESALLYSVRSGRVAIRPIAGTRPRGLHPDGSVDHERDTRLELELRTDAKEVAEHVMLVDLARNDVARVSRPGTRSVQDLLRVDRYSRVMHLVSEVSGELAEDLDALDAFRASMTMGTLTGAPKLRAAELIRQAEGVRRGSYGGSVGYVRGDGELDTCIVIRSGFVSAGTALVQAGAGVVAASSPAAEAAETVHKARAVLEAVAAAQGAALVIDQTNSQTDSRTGSRTSKEARAMPLTSSQSTRQATGSRAEASAPARVVLLDNRDSFVYNLVDQFATLGSQIEVYRNNVPASRVLAALEPTEAERQAGRRPVLCLSPGPGYPATSGCLMELIATALDEAIPTLGICLGFQALVEACGGRVAPVGPVHGRSDRLEVTEAGRADEAFAVLDGGPLDVARYHSLGTRTLPEALVSLARTTPTDEDPSGGIVMAARHRSLPAVGLQFHPESILTPQGPALLKAVTAGLARTP